MSSTHSTPGPTSSSPEPAHSCEHCSGAGAGEAVDPAARALEHVAIARRRVAPRLVLGALGLGIALVLAQRADRSLPAAAIAFVAAALAWLGAAWGGVVLGAALGARRGPWARLALGQVLAGGLAPVLALVIALGLGLAGIPDASATGGSGPLALLQAAVPLGVAAASGWFVASAVAEIVRLRALGAASGRQDETGMQARGEAHSLTTAALQRSELVALGVALAFGLALAVLVALPWAAIVLAPLAAAGAAVIGLRAGRRGDRDADGQRS